MFSDIDLFRLAEEGYFVGPDETEESFNERIQKFSIKNTAHFPSWVRIIYSNDSLLPWEGGALFSGEQTYLQLRKEFEKKDRYWGYKKEEILAHELIHALRVEYEEPIFEEVMAYASSPLFFRKFFGPIARTQTESVLLLISMLLLFLSFSFGLIPLFFLFRLISVQRTFTKTSKKFKKIGGEKGSKALYFLKDKEVELFAKLSEEKITSYLEKDNSLRIRQLRSMPFGCR